MVNVVATNNNGQLIMLTEPQNIDIDDYLLHYGIYGIIRQYVSDYFVRHKNGVFTQHYKLNKNVSDHMFVKVGRFIVNIDFSKLN